MGKFARSTSYSGRKSTESKSGVTRFATQAEASAGVATDVAITPKILDEAVDALVKDGTTTVKGIVRLATVAETVAGVLDTIANTPAGLAAVAIAGSPDWSETVKGIGQIATTAETVAYTLDDVAITPSKLGDAFAAPPAIGSGTPAAGAFTTIAASGLATLSASATIVTGATALALGADAGTGAINLGTGAAARTITLGNITTTTAVAINSGTGHITLTSTGTGDVLLVGGDKIQLDAAGTVDINSSAAVISIGNDDVDQAINIGTDGERTTTIGSSNGAASLVLDCGTGALNVGTNGIAHTVTIGNQIGATALVLETGTGNFSLDGVGATTYTIAASTTGGTIDIGGTAQTGTITLGDSSGVNIVQIGSGEGATTVNIAGGATSGKVVNIAVGAVANLVTVGSQTGASSLVLDAGSGDCTVNVTGGAFTVNAEASSSINVTGAGNDIDLDSLGGSIILTGNETAVDAITLSASDGGGGISATTGTGGVYFNLANGQFRVDTGTAQLLLGADNVAHFVTLGNDTGTSQTTINAGTNGMFLVSQNELSLDAVGALSLNSTGGTLNIGNDVEIFTQGVNLGSGASARTVVVGNITGISSLALLAGTGGITMLGTVQEITSEFTTRSGDSITFQQSPTTCTAADTGGVATGGTGDVNLLSFQEGIIMEQFIIGAGQTIIKPVMDATGLLVSGDQVVTEGFEYNFGAARTNSRHAFTIGTSAAFFYEVSMNVTDVSAGNPFVIGFRKTEANNAVFADYTDYASIGINTGTSAANVSILDELNGTGQNATNTTDAWTGGDGGTTILKVLVSAAGVVTYTIDGVVPTATAAYTFDTPDVVVPFIHLIQGGDLSPVHLISEKAGFQV